MDPTKPMGSALVFKDLFHLHPVWKTFIKSCLQTLMVSFILVTEIYLGGPSKVFSYSTLSSPSGHIRLILIRREDGNNLLMR